jgi:hypothetical protein
MITPPELDELVEMLLARPVMNPTPASELVDRSRRRRRRHRSRVTALSALAAIAAAAAVVVLNRPSGGTGLRVATRPPTTTTSAPQVLTVTCVGSAMHLSATVVQAQLDGVHVILKTTETQGDFSYRSLSQRLADGGEGGSQFSPGTGHHDFSTVLSLAPAKVALACASPPFVTPSLQRIIEVVDPHHYWIPWTSYTDPPCRRVEVKTTANGSNARTAVQNWLATTGHTPDQITGLGYPRDVHPTFGITQNAKLAAVVGLVALDGSNPQSWYINGAACTNF